MRVPIAAVLFLLQLTPMPVHSNRPIVAGSPGVPSSSSEVVTGNGLATWVLFTGADYANHRLTLSVRIKNTDATPAYLALVGPEPRAVDSAGGVYKLCTLSGIARCAFLGDHKIDGCIRNTNGHLPGTKFTLVPSGASLLLNIELSTRKISEGALVAFTMNVALGRATRPVDNRSSKPELEYVNLHLPLITLK